MLTRENNAHNGDDGSAAEHTTSRSARMRAREGRRGFVAGDGLYVTGDRAPRDARRRHCNAGGLAFTIAAGAQRGLRGAGGRGRGIIGLRHRHDVVEREAVAGEQAQGGGGEAHRA